MFKVFNRSVKRLDRVDFWIRFGILLFFDWLINLILVMTHLEVDPYDKEIMPCIIALIVFNIFIFVIFLVMGWKRFYDAGLSMGFYVLGIITSFCMFGVALLLYGFCKGTVWDKNKSY